MTNPEQCVPVLPEILNLELTNACNLACVFCDHRELARSMTIGNMPEGFLERLLQGLCGGPFHELGLVGLGEPLLDKQLAQHLALIGRYARLFRRISMNTNILALTRELAELICSSAVTHMTVSLNACDRETYAGLMGLDAFDRALEKIRLFMMVRSRAHSGLQVAIQVLDSELNDLKRVETLLGPSILSQAGLFIRKIYDKPAMHQNRPPLRVSATDTARLRYPCWSLYSRAYVDVAGNLYPCTIGNDCFRETSPLCLGNLHKTGLSELFNGPVMGRARERAEQGYPAFNACEQCNVWSLLPNHFTWDRASRIWIRRPGSGPRLKEMDWIENSNVRTCKSENL